MRARLALLAVAVSALAAATPAHASVEVPFTQRFSANVHGDVAIAADTLMTCPDGGGVEAACLEARTGAGAASLNNNGYKMGTVDIDSDATTFDSSQATLTLPPGATVLFAGLYYGARISAGEEGAAAPDPAARGSVLLQPPGASDYTSLAAEVHDSTAIKGAYVGFVDVTSLVAGAGAGSYRVADVQAGTGKDRYAGWSLLVAYGDPASPPRSLRVYDGLAAISQGEDPLQIGITGLETPSDGEVSAHVGLVAYEGDRGSTGDRLSLAGTPLFDAANPEKNVFNSSISVDGVAATAKLPDYVNQLGFDADLVSADGYLTNGATSAVLEESTSNEQYLTEAVSVAIELDPDVLEPPVIPPPPPPPPPTVEPSPPQTQTPKEPQKKDGSKEDDGDQANLAVDVEAGPTDARPTDVVAVRVSVESSGEVPLHGIEACNSLEPGLKRLTAPGASGEGATACWHLAKLAPGRTHTFVTTARVKGSAHGSLQSRTVVRAANAKARRSVTRIRVSPLPDLPCARAASAAALAHASC